ncbi:phosphonate C-P lyase system protein PhnG [Celeribacter litoreus]|uniref:phosphonate C-P lyase system protein PhnG n=1 Tax=Celeribacter litoreus TaxID=2876714 RepID=UPI001CC9471F|nr:phosphonate C-P lyase system protein PhnG [Celeribacter litoreus]MCA0044781.1 phosphonate C-P lyase system protein PhnG [Celeribacter litoreus]
MTDLTPDQKARQAWLSLLAKSPPAALAEHCDALGTLPDHTWLQPPETGAVMVRGRTGGTGAPFNLGEMTVTRCALTLETGEVGHGYVQGRDKSHAQRAAVVDALMQTDRANEVRRAVLTPLETAMIAAKSARAEKAAATKVDFFTMVRGED